MYCTCNLFNINNHQFYHRFDRTQTFHILGPWYPHQFHSFSSYHSKVLGVIFYINFFHIALQNYLYSTWLILVALPLHRKGHGDGVRQPLERRHLQSFLGIMNSSELGPALLAKRRLWFVNPTNNTFCNMCQRLQVIWVWRQNKQHLVNVCLFYF